jgi:hypothetical protein
MATDKNAQIAEITAKIEDGVKAIFTSEKYAQYLKTMAKFHSYSTRNTLLIHLQMPQATQVCGFQGWQQKFNRTVKRGEHAIKGTYPRKTDSINEHTSANNMVRGVITDEKFRRTRRST